MTTQLEAAHEIIAEQNREIARLAVNGNGAALPVPATPMAMIERALAQGAGIEVLERLMALQERWDAQQARKAFNAAIAAAKGEIGPIAKNRMVDFTSAKGRTNYRFEDLAEIERTVRPALSKHGLDYRFRTTSEPSQPITVTCIIWHRDGHCEETTLCAGRDESGNKNSIQSIGSTVSYLQRYTLKAALGLAASNDDDGRAAGPAEESGQLTESHIAEIRELLKQYGGDEARLCTHLQVESLDNIFARRFQDVRKIIISAGQKRKAQQ